jgi:hypothetical protein
MKVSEGFLFNCIRHCEKAFQPTKQSFLFLAKHFLKYHLLRLFLESKVSFLSALAARFPSCR